MVETNTRPALLTVDDESNIVRLFTTNFSHAGFEVHGAANCRQADSVLENVTPEVILMDWNLPDMSGVQYLKKLRRTEATAKTSILMVSARCAELDIVEALESGADDYIRKPFSMPELVRRVHAVMRRRSSRSTAAAVSETITDGCLRYGPLIINEQSQRVSCIDTQMRLGTTELRLLIALAKSPGRLFSREQLVSRVWGNDREVGNRTVDVHISRLRLTLGSVGLYHSIETVRNEGYRLANVC